ncbi:serine protease [Luteolibacter flavescens]|uniref:Serine protease n=1 Tax=Luteolibacter flavescens TaxID=1859460 RepID=A0ABT3FPE3_9BACT|nr:serine protease [Luteolibacter flavescens]MCW1885429.1 serine protease [Luteolibacter flavescens]
MPHLPPFKPLLLAILLSPVLSIAAPPVIDDGQLMRSFQTGVGAFVGNEGIPAADDIAKTSKAAVASEQPITLEQKPVASTDYEQISKSIFLVGSVYKCDKCSDWHAGGVATAWCVSEDGLMATNAHVLASAKGAAMGICDREGKCYPITSVVAVDPDADVALFRVKGEGFQPMPLGKAAPIGEKIRVISHPGRRYFMQTSGEVSRYYHQPAHREKGAATWMSITADYAKGSSGGPVFNTAGEVVGMVSSTQTIYYNSEDGTPNGPMQMVVKNCVPVDAIRALAEGAK